MKRVSISFLIIITGMLFNSCSTVNEAKSVLKVAAKEVSKSVSTVLSTLSAVSIQTNEVGFSPDSFKVTITEVKIREGVDGDWVTVFSGNAYGDIVQGFLLENSGIEIPTGEYKGVAITYNNNWNVRVTVLSNDLPGIVSNTITYYYTNVSSSTSSTILFATSDLLGEVTNDYPSVSADDIHTLTAPIDLSTEGATYVLSLSFDTSNMVRVWTNTNTIVNGPEYLVPSLTVDAVEE